MSEEDATAYGDMRELTRLRTALEAAQADVAALRAALGYYGTHEEDCAVWRNIRNPVACSCGYSATLTTEHPRDALLAELALARAFIDEISGAMLIGGWRDRQSTLLRAYEDARKASAR